MSIILSKSTDTLQPAESMFDKYKGASRLRKKLIRLSLKYRVVVSPNINTMTKKELLWAIRRLKLKHGL